MMRRIESLRIEKFACYQLWDISLMLSKLEPGPGMRTEGIP